MNPSLTSLYVFRLLPLLLLGLLTWSAPTPRVQAQEQPKPGPEHRKMEMYVGKWTYQGSGDATPFGPAGKFKGKATNRLVLGGFFLESRDEDTGDSGYIFQSIGFRGYDPVNRTYFGIGFENDGRETSATATLNGNTWTSVGVRKDAKGISYKTRNVETYLPDGKTSTWVAEYSSDDGKTWLPLWKGTSKRVGK